jgi:hypothetical protein
MPPKIAKQPTASAPALAFDPTNPFIVQSDRSVLVEVDNPKYAEARDALVSGRARLCFESHRALVRALEPTTEAA